MNYSREDYEELYGDHWVIRSSLRTRLMVTLLIVGWIAALLLVTGCDGEAAQITAYTEQEAHQRHVDSLIAAGWVKFQPTETPMRASSLGMVLTVCQQTPSRTWECFAK